jgi:uncharacterized integral membrane protein (TIGR00698 family)
MLARLRQISIETGRAHLFVPGLAACMALASLATVMAAIVGSAVVWGLLLGLTIASFWPVPLIFLPGIGFAAKHVLRVGVALLGFQISIATLEVLDLSTVAVLAANVAIILLAGWALGSLLGLGRNLSIIVAASVAICGASAAAAFAIVLMRDDTDTCDAACTIGAVSIVSSIAMLAYPPLVHLMGLHAAAGGILLGGTIHEVAHAVAAGYSVDPATGEVATMAKLLRVSMLAPASLLISCVAVRGAAPARPRIPLPPMFLMAFIGFALLNMSGAVPATLQAVAAPLSRFCLVMAMAAIGLTLPWQSIRSFGWRPIALLLLLTAMLLALVAVYIHCAHL